MRVLVIGAGVIGCAIAHELANRNVFVHVVDPRPIAGGATRASAGMLAPYSEGHHESLLNLGLASLALWDPFVERLRAESSTAFQYERAGTLQVAMSGDLAALAADAAGFAGRGVPHEWLEGRALRAFEPALGEEVVAGVLLPAQGYVDASGLTEALAYAAQQRGARFSMERVLALHPDAKGVSVTTSGGSLDADAVVLAAGSWSAALANVAEWPAPVTPVRGQLLRLRAPRQLAQRIVWGSRCYIVSWPDGTTLVGATVEDVGFNEQATAGGVRQLLDGLQALLPASGDAAFEEVRVGLRPRTPDELPIIGASSTMPHVFHATGHYRNGILLTPLTAKLIGDLLLDGCAHPELASTKPARFGL